MTAELPEDIDCRYVLTHGGVLEGTVGAERMERVTTPYRVAAPLTAQLRLRAGDGAAIHIDGRIRAPLEAQCQRCLEWMAWPVDLAVEIVAVPAGTAMDEDGPDWIETTDDRLALRAWLEDELLLGCPLAPRHDTAACSAGPERESGAERKQPFAGLADLLKRQD